MYTSALAQISCSSSAGLRLPALRLWSHHAPAELGRYCAPTGHPRPIRKYRRLLHRRFQRRLSLHPLDPSRGSAIPSLILKLRERGNSSSLRQTRSSNKTRQPNSPPDRYSPRSHRADRAGGRLWSIIGESSSSFRDNRRYPNFLDAELTLDNSSPIRTQDPASSGSKRQRDHNSPYYRQRRL